MARKWIVASTLFAAVAAAIVPMACGQEGPAVSKPATTTAAAGEFDLAAFEKKWPSKNKVVREKKADGSTVVSLAEPYLSRYDPRGTADYASGDWIVSNLGASPSIITPYVYTEATAAVIQEKILESLLTRDPDTYEWLPFLAESYEIKPDGLTFVFTIRKNATWSDGKPVTADDVEFSFNTIMEKGIDCDSLKSYYENVESVKKTGDRTVTWKFKTPYFQALEYAGGMNVIPAHVYAHKSAEEFNKRADLLVGSGPYIFNKENWQRGERMTLMRNPNYWGPKQPYERIVYKFITNPAAAFQAFQNGDIDTFAPIPEQYDRFSKDAAFKSKFQLFDYYRPNSGYRYIGWNEKNPLFADKETRQALTMLIDRKTIISAVNYNMARETTGPFSPMTPQCDSTIQPWPFDPREAKKKLAAAGWKLNANNVLVRNNVEFRFDITIPTDAPVYEKTCEIIKNQFEKAGIIMKITPFQWAVMVDRMDERKFDASMVGWTGGIEEDPNQIWHSSQIAGKGSNYISWKNEEADKLIDAGRKEMDETKRMEIWHKLHRVIHDEQPYTFLTFSNERSFIQQRFKNINVTRLGLNSDDWYVPAAQQKYK